MVIEEEAVTGMIKGKELATCGSTTTVDHVYESVKDYSSTTIQAEEIRKSTIGRDDQKKLSVLNVDDCSFVRLRHDFLVTNVGLESHIAENGKIAVDLHRSGASFHLILMDMEMPVINGLQATKELRAMGVDTMIVGVTANDRGPERQAFVEAGLNDCITKPFTSDNIVALVQVIKDTNEKSI
ncbi:hypothetical protein TIFTF001_029285 [Ficus carica]|uniref:Response regulatory domain-containing protein n=1 Tax=Ficus carica TaxID=3494 RepID=A0AA88IXT6_FICCA|nr:hypothetical protein TIFTF001_029285 [Ficus carica]